MNPREWQQILGWGKSQLDDLRFLAHSYAKQGAYDLALTLLKGLEILSAPHLFDLQMTGAIYLKKGEGLKALDYLDRALQLDTSDEATLLNRAKALFLLGYRKQGLKQARELKNSSNELIASQAQALILAYAEIT